MDRNEERRTASLILVRVQDEINHPGQDVTLINLLIAAEHESALPHHSSPPTRHPEADDVAQRKARLLRRISEITPESLAGAMSLA